MEWFKFCPVLVRLEEGGELPEFPGPEDRGVHFDHSFALVYMAVSSPRPQSLQGRVERTGGARSFCALAEWDWLRTVAVPWGAESHR